jgi:hypothetical protein
MNEFSGPPPSTVKCSPFHSNWSQPRRRVEQFLFLSEFLSRNAIRLEGSYEPVGSTLFSTLPGSFAPSTEERMISKVTELVGRVRQR